MKEAGLPTPDGLWLETVAPGDSARAACAHIAMIRQARIASDAPITAREPHDLEDGRPRLSRHDDERSDETIESGSSDAADAALYSQ